MEETTGNIRSAGSTGNRINCSTTNNIEQQISSNGKSFNATNDLLNEKCGAEEEITAVQKA